MEDASNVIAREEGHTQGSASYWEEIIEDGGRWVEWHRLSRKDDNDTMSIRWDPLQLMNKETTAGLWYRLESLYMMKSSSNKLFMKKQLYIFRKKKGTHILQYLKTFNKILSDLLALEVKLEEEDKAIIFSFHNTQIDN